MAELRKFRQALIALLLQQCAMLSLLFQLQGVMILWVIYNKRNSDLAVTDSLMKRNQYLRKMKLKRLHSSRRKPRSTWVKKGRTDLWWENMVNGLSPAEDWKKNFRMYRPEFEELCNELRLYILPDPRSPSSRALSVEKKVVITLYYIKDTGSLWMTANTFGVHQSTVSKVVDEVCKTIADKLGPRYIYLPKTVEDMLKKVSEFELKFGMIQAFGCIDGTHIPIKTPVTRPDDYFCYKQYYSLNVQGICDYRGIFIDVECLWPGSVHDAKVFANSSVNKRLINGTLPSTHNCLLPGYDKVPNYLIGDPAYPLTSFCMKEFQTCTTNAQVIFNNVLRNSRNQIECAFGRLKARWSILSRKMDLNVTSVPKVILACFVLHNFCELHGCTLDEAQIQAHMKSNQDDEEAHKNVPDPVYSCSSSEGEVVRDTLTSFISHNL